MKTIFMILLIIIAIKSILIGSEFSLHKWIKYGKQYYKDYINWINLKP